MPRVPGTGPGCPRTSTPPHTATPAARCAGAPPPPPQQPAGQRALRSGCRRPLLTGVGDGEAVGHLQVVDMGSQPELRSGKLNHPYPERAVLLIGAPREQPPCRETYTHTHTHTSAGRGHGQSSAGAASLPTAAGARVGGGAGRLRRLGYRCRSEPGCGSVPWPAAAAEPAGEGKGEGPGEAVATAAGGDLTGAWRVPRWGWARSDMTAMPE